MDGSAGALTPFLNNEPKAQRVAFQRMSEQAVLDPTFPGPESVKILVELQKRVIGQTDAAKELVNCLIRFTSGLRPEGRPLGIYLFTGPTGVGKTHLVEEFNSLIGHTPKSLLKIDCGEFHSGHEVARLIGAPPGYLGHRETTPTFTQGKLNFQHTEAAPFSIVLFDEIEKAHPALHDVLLGIMDRGDLRLGDGSTVDFSSTLLLMTANLGASEMAEALAPRWGLGAVPTAPEESQLKGISAKAASRLLRPEFINRMDKIITFHPLSAADLDRILDIQLARLETRLVGGLVAIRLQVEGSARELILKDGHDPKFGARHLRRSIERNLEMPLANLIASKQVKNRDHIKIDVADKTLQFTLL